MSEQFPCPHCGSTATIAVANTRHCNQCGKNFNEVRPADVLSEAARRRKAAAGNYPGWERKREGVTGQGAVSEGNTTGEAAVAPVTGSGEVNNGRGI